MEIDRSTLNSPLSILGMCLVSLYSLALPSRAHAAEFCADMTTLTELGRANFLDQSTGISKLSAPPPLHGAESCRMTRSLSGNNAFSCAWKFPYRDGAANAAFDTINQGLRGCFSEANETVVDEGVNHPDTYHQRQYDVDQIIVSVSIKDKGALQETYVFLNVQGVAGK